MKTHFSYCRKGSCYCGVEIQEIDGEWVVSGDRANPKNAGFLCSHVEDSIARSRDPNRIKSPLKRNGDEWTEVSWDKAITEIGRQLKALRKTHGTEAIGVFGGSDLGSRSLDAIRTAAFAIGMGTPHLYTEFHLHGASQLVAAEAMMGLPMALQSDVGRAHYTLLLGDCDQDRMGWGPLQGTTIHTQALRHIQRMRRSAKLIAVGPRKTELAEQADEYVAIRPGTETVFLLGMCHATWNSGWIEHQYLRDYCVNSEKLTEWLAPWTPAAVGEVCGIEPKKVSGIALRFSRAPMATVAKSPALFNHEHGTAAAWAWHLLHAMTANLLRPGGLFEAVGLIDLLPAALAFPSKDAPKSRVSGHPAVGLQMPASALCEEIETPGKGQLRALLCIHGDPAKHHPQPGKINRALDSLELLVCVDTHPNEATQKADWILPSHSVWEQSDFHFIESPILPYKYLQATGPLFPPPEDSRSVEAILADLFRATGAPFFGGAWGSHIKGMGRWLATTNLETQANRILKWAAETDLEQLRSMPHGLDRGEFDRSLWRVSTPGEKIDLAPESLEESVLRVRPPGENSDAKGFWLVTKPLNDLEADTTLEGEIGLHPDSGFEPGSRVKVTTDAGSIEGRVRTDDRLHPEGCHIPWNSGIAVGELISDQERDPQTGTPNQSGVACELRPL